MSTGRKFLSFFVGFILFLIGGILSLGALGDGHMLGFVLSLTVAIIGFYIFRLPKKSSLKRDEEIRNLPEVKNSDYSHVFENTAIAVNKKNGTLFLAAGNDQKVYQFENIRGWNYSFKSGGTVTGGGLNGVGHNAGVHSRNRAETGFFVETKDIEFPEWQIMFKYNSSTEKELKKWMEILRQSINEA